MRRWPARFVTRTVWIALLLSLPANLLWGAVVDPHGKPDDCHYCHGTQNVEKGNPIFRAKTVVATCRNCHGQLGNTLKDYLLRMLPDEENKEELVNYFGDLPGFACDRCHHVMCQSNSREELRGRNPHVQLDSSGNIIRKACLFCHEEVLEYRQQLDRPTTMRYDSTYLCSLCHLMPAQMAGLGVGEYMPPEMIRRKKQFEIKHDVKLPLGPDDKVICPSCHDPHQPGVRLSREGAQLTPGTHQLRMRSPWELCPACHQMDN